MSRCAPARPAVLLALVLAGCASLMPARRAVIYVANMDSHSISVIDSGSLKSMTTIDARGEETHDLFLTPDGRRLFAANMSSGTVTVVDTSTQQVVGNIPTGKTTHAIAVTPDGKELWVNAAGEDHIPVVSTASLQVVARVSLGEPIATGHIWFSPNGRTAWATSPKFNQVFVVDVPGRRVTEKVPVGKGPTFIQVTDDGREVWGTNTGESSIYVIEADTRRVTKLEIGKMPQHLTFVGDKVYVTLGGQNQVAVLDRAARIVVARVSVGKKPHGIWPSSDGKRLYVTHEDSDDMAVIDVAAGRIIGTVPVGKKPTAVVVAH